ncbi:hypothetical protein PV10_01219 [Exophiala mesophila]|uniref:UBC core domain-containing protein n=1 Tax=Exophiala mesophila TaxID=212818 RepID=A0A0D2AEY5_EXOME|nr:uncharacterized protein PV10_01219 [Exophiala mesophila]KIV97468.1 hypothetical protein PV10_01219 [Exophiala mesophila]
MSFFRETRHSHHTYGRPRTRNRSPSTVSAYPSLTAIGSLFSRTARTKKLGYSAVSDIDSTRRSIMSFSEVGGRKAAGSSSGKTALKRLTRELQTLAQSPPESALHLGPSDESDLFHWEAVLKGPRDVASPYHGGLWLLDITVPPNYPNAPPKIKFVTPICHPNVHFSTGEICLTLLSGKDWTAAYNLGTTISAIQQLLSDPGNDSPLNVDIANLYREHDDIAAEGLIRFWTGEKRWAGEGKAGFISEKFKGSGGKLGE